MDNKKYWLLSIFELLFCFNYTNPSIIFCAMNINGSDLNSNFYSCWNPLLLESCNGERAENLKKILEAEQNGDTKKKHSFRGLSNVKIFL